MDDLTFGHVAEDSFNTDILAEATNHVITAFEKALNLEVSETKSVVTASTEKQALDIASKITSNKVQPHKHAKMLGAITCSGRRRCVYQLKTRLNGTKTKANRIRKLRRCGVNTAVWVSSAGIPGMLYSADITRVADSMLKAQRLRFAF